ncbi:MAG: ribosome-associated translation inhibitor RaiA [Calditrichaeota bacterium]|nr:ribosome-associated translation inhibitor RaiA [Calditrichota bacterium]
MEITISTRRFEPTEKLLAYANKEIDKLGRYFDGDLSGTVMLDESGNRKIVEARITALGKVMTVQLEGNDLYKLIPKAVDKLASQLKSHKSKIRGR